ncbi:hypothetical protein BH10PLA2_BH10PLA2_30600 [soil metagenome]
MRAGRSRAHEKVQEIIANPDLRPRSSPPDEIGSSIGVPLLPNLARPRSPTAPFSHILARLIALKLIFKNPTAIAR